VVVDLIDNTIAAATMFIMWGTGGSSTGATATKGDTGLFVSATETFATTAVSQPAADTNQWVGTLTAGTAKTIEEAGLFTASSGAGSLVIHGNFGGIALATGDSIQFTVSLEQT
jgi:hypothetical protein